MKIYLSGGMRGLPDQNCHAFNVAAIDLRADGHEVFNPADTLVDGREPPDFDLRKTFAADMQWICLYADAIAMLPGWENSKGAKAERATAIALGIEVIYLPTVRAVA